MERFVWALARQVHLGPVACREDDDFVNPRVITERLKRRNESVVREGQSSARFDARSVMVKTHHSYHGVATPPLGSWKDEDCGCLLYARSISRVRV
jgi:hypothetical protein